MIEYKVVTNSRDKSIETVINEAARDGWSYKDTLATYEYIDFGSRRGFTVLMERKT